MVAVDAIVHMRDFTREMGFKQEAAGVNYQHPVICAMLWVEFPRGEEHHHTTTTNPDKVTCEDCIERMPAYALELIEKDEAF